MNSSFVSFMRKARIAVLAVLSASLFLAGCEEGNSSGSAKKVTFRNESSQTVTYYVQGDGVKILEPGESHKYGEDKDGSGIIHYELKSPSSVTAVQIDWWTVTFRDK